MTNNKTQLRRLLLLEVCLAVSGIILAGCLYIHANGQLWSLLTTV